MRVFGIVAEFNPFHNGHQHFIEQIHTKYHPDVLIAVMSGNFVQRGDFAILDKHTRAKNAVDHGIDLVIELPFAKAVQPADMFANKSVELLHSLGVTDIVFGTEEELDFQNAAKLMCQNRLEFAQDFHTNYAQNLNNSLKQHGIDTFDKPNQLLGINYVAAIMEHGFDIQEHFILRPQHGFSATNIRKNLLSKSSLSVDKSIPKDVENDLSQQQLITWEKFFPYLRYNILSKSLDELQLIYQMVEGLENKVKKDAYSADSFDSLSQLIKSKRYTLARIRRLLMYVLINVENEEMKTALADDYLQVLAFDQVGQKYLNSIKKQLDIPLITRVGKQQAQQSSLAIKADSIYQMINQQEQNFGVIPYIKEENNA
ncbi:nucleotidyltransferase [Companilactobacillus furfuricola]|uniref:nucleotidyltransferase n=1 Tax=Companilactobacillus furfuricola TaxID=1462575 RepID=UPI000F7817FD|nr:nucleotidyltransferase [Companilactobacillus furfuricola]